MRVGERLCMEQDVVTEAIEVAVPGVARPMRVVVMRGAAAEGRRPCCLLFPEIFGLTPAMHAAAARMARAGYLVAMPDLHHRSAPNTVLAEDEAGRARGLALLRELRRETVLADIGAVLAALAGRGDCGGGTALLGFSAGGHVAYLAAAHFDVALAVSVYGGWITNADIPLSQPEPTITLTPEIGRRRAEVLYVVGDQDHLITPDQAGAIEAALAGAGVAHEVVVIGGAKHGFMVPGRASYDAVAAETTWARILARAAARLR